MESYRELKDIGNALMPIRLYHIEADKYKGLNLQFFSGFGSEAIREVCQPTCVTPHWHSYFEIIHVLEGTAEMQLNSEYLKARAGDTVLIDNYDIHNVTGECKYLVINIEPSQIPHIQTSFDELFPKSMNLKWIRQNTNYEVSDMLRDSVKDVFELYKTKPKGYMLLVMSRIYEMLGKIHGYSARTKDGILAVQSKREDLTQLTKTMEYIRNNYMKGISLDDISREIGFTPTYFCRFFKRAMGKTFFEYLNYYRCSKAEVLINTTTMTITEIALEVGFSSISYFDKVYKKFKGKRPSEEKARVKADRYGT